MVLFQINPPSIAVDPLKGDGPGPIHVYTVSLRFSFYQVAEKVIFRRLLKNAQMQGPRNPEE